MSNRKQNTTSYLISFSFIIVSFVLCVELFCFNTNIMNFIQNHITLFDKTVCEYIGIDNDTLLKLDENTLNIIQGKEYDKQFINSYMHDYEVEHLVDCQKLNDKALIVMYISLAILVISLFIFIKNRMSVYLLFKAYKNSLIITILFVVFLVLFALIDFYTFWTCFHLVMFPGNDGWLLSYSKDVLLMMVPQQFFEMLVGFIIVGFTTVCIITLIILNNLRKKIYD